jgi:hypothetical protein
MLCPHLTPFVNSYYLGLKDRILEPLRSPAHKTARQAMQTGHSSRKQDIDASKQDIESRKQDIVLSKQDIQGRKQDIEILSVCIRVEIIFSYE